MQYARDKASVVAVRVFACMRTCTRFDVCVRTCGSQCVKCGGAGAAAEAAKAAEACVYASEYADDVRGTGAGISLLLQPRFCLFPAAKTCVNLSRPRAETQQGSTIRPLAAVNSASCFHTELPKPICIARDRRRGIKRGSVNVKQVMTESDRRQKYPPLSPRRLLLHSLNHFNLPLNTIPSGLNFDHCHFANLQNPKDPDKCIIHPTHTRTHTNLGPLCRP